MKLLRFYSTNSQITGYSLLTRVIKRTEAPTLQVYRRLHCSNQKYFITQPFSYYQTRGPDAYKLQFNEKVAVITGAAAGEALNISL